MATHRATANQVLQSVPHRIAATGAYLECQTLGMNFSTLSCWQWDLERGRHEGGDFAAMEDYKIQSLRRKLKTPVRLGLFFRVFVEA